MKRLIYLFTICASFLFVCCEKTAIEPENAVSELSRDNQVDFFQQRNYNGPFDNPVAISREQFRFLGMWQYFDEFNLPYIIFYNFCDNDTCYNSEYSDGVCVTKPPFKYIVTKDSLFKVNDNIEWNEETLTRHKYYFIGKDTLIIEHFIRLDIDVFPPQYIDLHLKRVY